MCARLLSCPLCSQPGFETLDSLRAGLISVATRPLACPVCNEVLLGIDKLTIHLFSHTIAPENSLVGASNEPSKLMDVNSQSKIPTVIPNNSHELQSWNLPKSLINSTTTIEASRKNTSAEIFIPIEGVQTFNSLSDITHESSGILRNNNQIQNIIPEAKGHRQIFLLQNVSSHSDIFSSNLINQRTSNEEAMNTDLFQDTSSSITKNYVSEQSISESTPMDQTCREIIEIDVSKPIDQDNDEPTINNFNDENEPFSETWLNNNPDSEKSSNSNESVSHTDRLAELVKSAQITASPLGTFHESFDCSRPKTPDESAILTKPVIKSAKIIPQSERTERCNICGLYFPDRKILILHKQFLHKIKERDSNLAPEDLMKNFPCHLCTKVFKMRGSLMVHMRVAHPGFHTNCKLNEPIKEAIKLRVQQSMQNPKEQTVEEAKEIVEKLLNFELEGGYNCPTCGKNFKKEQHVIQHIKTHEGKQWECDVCTKMFTTKYFLKKHKRLHSGEMPYKCNLCDKTFTFQQSYHKHRMYHKDEKPHTCVTCGRSFKELSTLHNHERIHTGEKPFACETCGKCFRQRVSYLVHQRIHTGVMPYQCSICGRNFRYKVSQRTHKCSQPSLESVEQKVLSSEKATLNTDQNICPSAPVEEPQYIFIFNEDGKHILKKKSEVENVDGSIEKNESENEEKSDKKGLSLPDLWGQELIDKFKPGTDNIKSNESVSMLMQDSNVWNVISNTKENSNMPTSKQFHEKELTNDHSSNPWKQSTLNNSSYEKSSENYSNNDHADIFSMIISSSVNEISSPSAKLKDLSLSSPVNHQDNQCETDESMLKRNNTIQVDDENTLNNYNDSNINLQTINEDSLKELLYSISGKQL